MSSQISFLDVAYAGTANKEQTLDIYLPTQTLDTRAPMLIVFLHGGAWRSGDKSEWTHFGEFFPRHGFAFAIPNYRLSHIEDGELMLKHPEHLMDCAKAVEFCWKNGEEYGFDATRIILSGHSAGGQLSGLLVLQPKWLEDLGGKELYDCIRGCVGIEGIYDIPRIMHVWPSYMDFIEMAFNRDAALWKGASPQYHRLPSGYNLVPYLIVHSPEDELVDDNQAIRYHAHLISMADSGAVYLEMGVEGKHFEMLKESGFLVKFLAFVQNL